MLVIKIMMVQSAFENIYEKYSAIIYGIALEICPNVICAELVFTATFKKIYNSNITVQNSPIYYIELIRLVFRITKNEIYPHEKKINFKLKQFDTTPLLQQLICNEISLDNYCILNNIEKNVGLRLIKSEFNSLRNLKTNQSKKFELS